MTHDPLLEQVAQQFRMMFQLGACDPADCPLCDCLVTDDAMRNRICEEAERLAQEVIAKVRADEQGKQRNVWTSTLPQPQERRVIR